MGLHPVSALGHPLAPPSIASSLAPPSIISTLVFSSVSPSQSPLSLDPRPPPEPPLSHLCWSFALRGPASRGGVIILFSCLV